MFDVADDPDNRYPVYLIVTRPADTPAERVLFLEKAARQTLIDDPDQRRVLVVLRREVASREQWDLHDAEVISLDAARLHIRLFALGQLLPFDQKVVRQPVAAHRQLADQRRPRARQRTYLLKQRAAISRLLRRLLVARLWQLDPHRQQVVDVETGLDVAQSPEAFDQQPRANQQHQRQRHLNHHQGAAQTMFCRASLTAPPFLQRIADVDARGLPGRRQAEDDAGQYRDRESEEQRAPVHADCLQPRQVRGFQRDEQINSPDGE